MKMKDSGIVWLGEIPEYWEIKKVKQVAKVVTGKTPSEESYQDWGDELMFITPTDCLVDQKYVSVSERRLSCEGIKNFSSLIVPKDSVLVSCIASIGKVAINTEEALTNQQINTVIPYKSLSLPDFLFYQLLIMMPFVEKSYCGYSTLPIINKGDFSNLSLIIPPIEEQKAIAEFLDEKCNQLDQAIEKKQRLMTLLDEQKQALIHQTITKGLDPSISLKDSGIAWLGEIPEHWEVRKLKYCYKMLVGFTPSTEKQQYYDHENGHVWITISDINKKYLSDSAMKISDLYIQEENPILIPKNSLLYSFKLSVGLVAFNTREVYTNEAIISFLDDKKVSLPFLYYSSRLIAFNANENIYGAKILNQALIRDSDIVFPPIKEQKAIAEFLDEKCEKIDQAIDKIKAQIKLFKEYKNTLISEAVCGRIKEVSNPYKVKQRLENENER